MPFGATLLEDGRVRFRLYAPAVGECAVAIEGRAESLGMRASGGGWHELVTGAAGVGSLYRYVLAGGRAVADPASRFQPQGSAGPSEVVDPAAFAWTDAEWRGRPWHEAVVYEAHVGTWTQEGTFRAAIAKLDHLVALGANTLELMAVGEFPGRWGWGYDPVLWFAPHAAYGRPDDLRALVDAAHARGIAVVVDVVYNHFGPEDNYIAEYFPGIYSACHETPWGKGLNFDGPGSEFVRSFAVENALYWLREFHADGLRLDATHAMIDTSRVHILDELAERVRRVEWGRPIYLVLEHEMPLPEKAGRPDVDAAAAYTAQWNYETPRVLTPVFGDFCPLPLEDTERLAMALAHGYVAPTAEPLPERVPEAPAAPAFVCYLQTHDLVGNRIKGDRLASVAGTPLLRTLAALYLLLPQTPLVFMGEEWGARTPFPFFLDCLREAQGEIVKQRAEGFRRMVPKPSEEEIAGAPDPFAESTFVAAKLDWEELAEPEHAGWLAFYRDALRVRRERIVPLLAGLRSAEASYRVLGAGAFAAEWVLGEGARLRLAVNLCQEARAGFARAEGEVLWSEGDAGEDGVMGGYALRWTLSGVRGKSAGGGRYHRGKS